MSKLGRYSADRKKVETLSASKTITVADCGTLFILSADQVTASLPNASDAGKGWWAKFIMTADIADGVAIAATAGDGDNIHGVGLCASGSGADPSPAFPDGTNAQDTASNKVGSVDLIMFHSASSAGDQVELVCDGTNWFATVIAFDVNAISFD